MFRPRLLSVGVLLALSVLISGCVTAAPSVHRTTARDYIGELVRSIGGDRHDDIYGFARAAAEAIETNYSANDNVSLVGIDELEPSEEGDPFGRLTFRVQFEAAHLGKSTVDAFDACYEAGFDRYGATDLWVWRSPDLLRESYCPENAIPVVPPIDTSIVYVVAPNAEDAATQVLTKAFATHESDSNAIEAKILALLEAPVGEFEQLAVPTVLVDGGNVGVAMGETPHECVLVAQVDGVVSRVRPAAIRLEKGELGCRPSTALADPSQLGSPH